MGGKEKIIRLKAETERLSEGGERVLLGFVVEVGLTYFLRENSKSHNSVRTWRGKTESHERKLLTPKMGR